MGYDVVVLEADFHHILKESIKERFPECVYIHVPPYKKNVSLKRIKSHLVFGKSVSKYLESIKPDFIYLQIPPNNTARYCTEYKTKHPNTILMLDIIDLWPESMPIGLFQRTPMTSSWKNMRNDAIKLADFVLTECNLYQEKLSGIILPQKTSTLHLCKKQTIEECRLIREMVKQDDASDIIRFAYLGSMNNILDIENICYVISTFIKQGKKCELHAIGAGESSIKFEDAVKDIGCNTFFYGTVFDEIDKINILAPCDYAFNMMKTDVSVGLTIKSIDYLSYGLPIINNIKGDTWEMVQREKIGINVDGNNLFMEETIVSRDEILNFFENNFSQNAFQLKVDKVFNLVLGSQNNNEECSCD